MAWNIMLFNKTFHVEHTYFFNTRSTITNPHQTGMYRKGRGYIIEIIIDKGGDGRGYQKLQS